MVGEERFGKLSEKKFQGSGKHRRVIAILKGPPLVLEENIGSFHRKCFYRSYPVDLGANLLHLAGVTRDSVEPISLEEVLLRFKLLHRFPNKRRDLDGLIGCYLVLGECFLSSQLDKTLI